MSFFARANRYLTRGMRLMIHERRLVKTLKIDGSLTTCIADVKATLNDIECCIAIENEGYQTLILGSDVTMEELLTAAPENCYIEASEAQTRGLVEGVI
jgi:hypothetical protein